MGINPVSIIGFICGGLFIVLVGGGSLFLIISWWRNKKKAENSQAWPLVMGVVMETDLRIGGGIGGGEEFIPVIRYRYTVNDQMYQSEKFSFGRGQRSVLEREAQDILDQYPINSEVTVYYNPDDPQEAVLVRESKSTKIGLVVGVVMLVTVVCLMCTLIYFLFDLISKSL